MIISRFYRNVALLASGTIFAQAINVLSLPVLTRLYSPEDFSTLALFMAIQGPLVAFSCLRYNLAIPLPRSERTAQCLLILATCSGVLISLVLAGALSLLAAFGLAFASGSATEDFLWMIPVGVAFASGYNALQFWMTRRKRFKTITTTRVTRSLGGAGTQIGLGLLVTGPFGLVFGHMLSNGLGMTTFVRSLVKEDVKRFRAINRKTLFVAARKFKNFPLYSVPETLFNSLGTQAPVILISAYAIGPEAGFLLLAMRVISLPLTLLGVSISQVYLSEAPDKFIKGELAAFTKQIMSRLFRYGAPVIILISVIAPFVVPIIFGPDWTRAGLIIAWLTPWSISKFVASPVTAVLHVVGQIKTAMLVQLFGFVLRTGAVLLAAFLAPEYMVEIFAITGAVFSTTVCFLILKIAEKH